MGEGEVQESLPERGSHVRGIIDLAQDNLEPRMFLPEDLQGWGEPVGTVTNAKSLNEVELHLEEPAKYFLIWFNKAAPAQDQEGRYQVEISDVKLID